MNLRVSDRSKLIVQSEIRNMTIECNMIKGINLAQGVCDLDVPKQVIDGATEGMKEGYNLYTRYDGLPIIREALAKKVSVFNGIKADPEKNIIVSAGATGAFYCTCMALLNPGDEVIVIEPYYGYHVNTLLAVGVVPVYARLDPPDWQFSTDVLEPLITDRTRAVIINTPGNPSGKVFTEGEIAQLADFAVEKDIFIFTDRDIRVLCLRRKKAHISWFHSQDSRPDDHHLWLFEDLQHYRVAHRILRGAGGMGQDDRIRERPRVCLRPVPAAGGSSEGSGLLATVVLSGRLPFLRREA